MLNQDKKKEKNPTEKRKVKNEFLLFGHNLNSHTCA